jgi:mersacidin/lichenicidin family type 2 lantibiotic
MMNIIRAWKDEEYRMSLSDEERSLLPDNPAGPMELSDAELDSIVGGGGGSNNGGGTAVIGCSVACNSVACGSVLLCSHH